MPKASKPKAVKKAKQGKHIEPPYIDNRRFTTPEEAGRLLKVPPRRVKKLIALADEIIASRKTAQ